MSDEPDNLVLRYLRRIDEKLDRLAEDVSDLKRRMSATEESIVGLTRRVDRVETRLERIERRLDLLDPVHP